MVVFGHDSMKDVWIQLHNLPIFLLSEQGARKAMSKVGEVTDFDPRVLLGEFGNFVRICIRLQSNKPLRRGGYIRVLGERIWLQYIYEGITWVCGWCGCFVHKPEMCEEEKRGRETKSVEGYGSWMLDGKDEQKKTDGVAPLAANSDARTELNSNLGLGQPLISIGKEMMVLSNSFASDALSVHSVERMKEKGTKIAVDSLMTMVQSKRKIAVKSISAITKEASCLLLQCKQSIRRWEFKGWDPGQPRSEDNTPLVIANSLIISSAEVRGLFGLSIWELWLMRKARFFEDRPNREDAFTRDDLTVCRWKFKRWDPGQPNGEEVRGLSGLFMWELWLLRKSTFFDGSPKRGEAATGVEGDAKVIFEDFDRLRNGFVPEDVSEYWDNLLECVELANTLEDTIVN